MVGGDHRLSGPGDAAHAGEDNERERAEYQLKPLLTLSGVDRLRTLDLAHGSLPLL